MSAPDPSNGGQPTPQGNPVLQSYRAWSERTPIVTRSTTVGVCVVYLLSWFLNINGWLANIPFYTLAYVNLWRLVTSPLAGNSFFTLILLLLTYPTIGTKLENSMGSAAFLVLMGMIVIGVNLLFCLTCVVLALFGLYAALFYQCMDFWTVLFAFINIDCLADPDRPRRLLCFPYDIPSKYIPVLLFVIICLFSGFSLSYALALMVGWMYSKGYLDKMRPSSQRLEQWEAEGGWLHRVSRVRGWVLAGTLGHDAWIPLSVVDADAQQGHSQHSSASTQGYSQTPGQRAQYFGSGTAGGSAAPHAGEAVPVGESFPGHGHKLSSAPPAAVAALPLATPLFSGTYAAPPPSAGESRPTREEMAARRLAALQKGGSEQV